MPRGIYPRKRGLVHVKPRKPEPVVEYRVIVTIWGSEMQGKWRPYNADQIQAFAKACSENHSGFAVEFRTI